MKFKFEPQDLTIAHPKWFSFTFYKLESILFVKCKTSKALQTSKAKTQIYIIHVLTKYTLHTHHSMNRTDYHERI